VDVEELLDQLGAPFENHQAAVLRSTVIQVDETLAAVEAPSVERLAEEGQ
jgi:hypothetical protein